MTRKTPRRRFLGAAAAAIGLAGCSTREQSTTAEATDGETDDSTTSRQVQPTQQATTAQSTPTPEDATTQTTTSDEEETTTTVTTTEDLALELDVGAVYMTFFADPNKWDTCAGGTPAPGHYDMTQRDAVAQHLAWMDRFGISRLMLSFGVPSQAKPFLATLDELRSGASTGGPTAGDGVAIEPMYGIPNAMRWGQDDHVAQLKSDFDFFREEILSRDDVATVDGRPVLSIWDIGFVTVSATDVSTAVRGAILQEWGDYPSFIEFARERMTVDGVEPYLVGGVRDHMQSGPWPALGSLSASLDGLQTWIDSFSGGAVTEWPTVREDVRMTFAATRDFARRENIDFVPTVFPGFDDRSNQCWGGDRSIPRSKTGLADLFEMADEFRTGDRVMLGTFNDWGEGSQVEPGTWQGEQYGTKYLEVVKDAAVADTQE